MPLTMIIEFVGILQIFRIEFFEFILYIPKINLHTKLDFSYLSG